MEQSKLKLMTYKPWTFAINGHWQAILFPLIEIGCNLFRKIPYIREDLILSDGGTVILEWADNPSLPNKKLLNQDSPRDYPLAIVLPGLTGGSIALYVTSTATEAWKHNYDVVVINYRS
mmetsp:Transcript_6579/g.5873  ORF Transcript_6579/g.5873 Transcript_6579/m.5873 type:complete len:119 (+) Transcript_6579:237-593(+)